MNIVVLVKQVPVVSDMKIDHEKLTVDRSGVGSMTNPGDLHAIEAALCVRDALGGTVTALSMGPETCEVQLKEALSMGANTAVRITDAKLAGADTLVTAKALAAAVRKLGGADLVLCGTVSIDGATGQTGAKLAALLDARYLDGAVELKPEADALTIRRKAGDGYEVWKAGYPLVCSVAEDANKPRMATMKGRLAAKKAVIQAFSAEELGLTAEDLKSTTRIESLKPAPERGTGIEIEAEDEAEAARKLVGILLEQQII